MKTRNKSISGFSLVEVSLALGVIVFCFVTILGVLAVGINSTHVSTVQTAATNILTAVAADLEATGNYTPSNPGKLAKGNITKASPMYGITLPATGAATPSVQTVFIGENGQLATAATALYVVNVWVTPASSTKQETFARLLISWPPSVPYTSAQGYVENVIAINRT